ncbi:hypothetical protein AnigIFM56816_007132 [Aspergillus niger]|nr:hypothetical protein AnigIFM56816_007132 [Aspergillus niger]
MDEANDSVAWKRLQVKDSEDELDESPGHSKLTDIQKNDSSLDDDEEEEEEEELDP